MSAVMQLGLALPMACYFHRATSVAMPANLPIIPLLQVLMPAVILAIITSYVSLMLAKIPGFIAGLALEGIAGTVKWLGGLRLADIRVLTPSPSAIIFAGIAIWRQCDLNAKVALAGNHGSRSPCHERPLDMDTSTTSANPPEHLGDDRDRSRPGRFDSACSS
jgi:hypothetical protein